MKILSIIATLATLFLSCAPGVFVKKDVIFRSPALNPVDICREGLCVLPFWDETKDTIISQPQIEQLVDMIKKSGHRQLKIKSYKKIVKRLKVNYGSPEYLLIFESSAFSSDDFKLSPEVFQYFNANYFLRISLKRGEMLTMFNAEKKFSLQLDAKIYNASSQKIIWHARAYCKGKPENNRADLLPGIRGLIDILPVNPNVSNLGEQDTW